MQPPDLSRNLKPCPNPHCRKDDSGTPSMDLTIEKEGDYDTQRHRITCNRCSYSSGWFENFHEMVAWWNKYSRMPATKTR